MKKRLGRYWLSLGKSALEVGECMCGNIHVETGMSSSFAEIFGSIRCLVDPFNLRFLVWILY